MGIRTVWSATLWILAQLLISTAAICGLIWHSFSSSANAIHLLVATALAPWIGLLISYFADLVPESPSRGNFLNGDLLHPFPELKRFEEPVRRTLKRCSIGALVLSLPSLFLMIWWGVPVQDGLALFAARSHYIVYSHGATIEVPGIIFNLLWVNFWLFPISVPISFNLEALHILLLGEDFRHRKFRTRTRLRME